MQSNLGNNYDKEDRELLCAFCPLCNADSHVSLHRLHSDIHFGVCGKCGLAYLNPLPSDSELLEIYNSFKQSWPNPEIIADNSDFSLIAKDRFSFVTENKDLLSICNLLDIGSGYGLFLNCFRETKWQTHGVEPSTIPAAFSRNELCLTNIQNCMFAEAIFESAFFDVICSFHVIEHFSNPILMLNRIKNILKPDGKLFLAVPDLTKIPADIRHYFFLYHRLHLTIFTPATINSLLQKCGFEIVRLQQEVDRSAESGSMIIEARHADKSNIDHPEDSKFAVLYANKLNKMQKKLTAQFLDWRKQSKIIAIYGGGVHTQGLLECVSSYVDTGFVKIIFDDDPAKSGGEICNIPIQPFSDEHLQDIDIILVSSLVSEQLILNKLNNDKYKHIELVGVYRDILNEDQ